MDANPLLYLAVLAALVFAVLYLAAIARTDRAAKQKYERWLAADVARIIEEQKAIARREAHAELDQWRNENESAIREDAIGRSRSVIVGKVTEHMTPWIPDFPYNPKDARFLGSPVDLVIFDGLAAGDVKRVVFLEVKTGGSPLTTRERQVRDVIDAREVVWAELRLNRSVT